MTRSHLFLCHRKWNFHINRVAYTLIVCSQFLNWYLAWQIPETPNSLEFLNCSFHSYAVLSIDWCFSEWKLRIHCGFPSLVPREAKIVSCRLGPFVFTRNVPSLTESNFLKNVFIFFSPSTIHIHTSTFKGWWNIFSLQRYFCIVP